MRTVSIFLAIIFLLWLEGFLEGVMQFDFKIGQQTIIVIIMSIFIVVAMAQDIKELFRK